MVKMIWVVYSVLVSTLQVHGANSNATATPNALLPTIGDHVPQHAWIGSQRCMKELGCFTITKDFFHPFYRPINLLPHDRVTINTQFHLYTKEHPKEEYLLTVDDIEEIKHSPLIPSHRTILIVHGFIDSRFYGKWMEVVKDNILLQNDYNVIIVDWSKGNGAPYTQAAANARVVGAEIALLIQILEKVKGVSPMDCHIIGHSLGAHAAGYAGSRLQKLRRITGLDPAQPYFQNMPASVRLDRTDADFVDVIHTDSASSKFLPLGMSQAIGHVDFYPNNGMSQPGCASAAIHAIFVEGLIDAARRFVSCNHQRSIDFFTYSINYRKALPVAYNCLNWEHYISGHCADCGKNGQKCAVLGLQAEQYKQHKNDSQSVRMFLATSPDAPFWEFLYQVTLKLRKPKQKIQDVQGGLYLKIEDSKGIHGIQMSTKSGDLVHGSTYVFLVRKRVMIGKIKQVTFSWTSSSWNILWSREIHLDFIKLVPMNFNDTTTQKEQTKLFCPKTDKAVKTKQPTPLINCK